MHFGVRLDSDHLASQGAHLFEFPFFSKDAAEVLESDRRNRA